MQIVLVGATRSRALPQFPIKLRRDRNLFTDANRLAHVGVPRLRHVRPADDAVVNLCNDLDGVGRGALLIAHLHELAIFLLRFNQHLSFGGIVAAGFFQIHVLAGLQAGNGQRGMPMVGRGNRDGVDLFGLEDFAEVFLCRRYLSCFLLYCVGELVQDVAVHVAHMRDACGRPVRFQGREVCVAAPVQPNDGKIQAFVGTQDPGIASCGPGNKSRRPYGKRIQEFASRHHCFSLL